MPTFGDTETIIARQGATPSAFGFEDAADPQDALETFVQDLQARASDEVERYCKRSFGLHQGETDVLTGNNASTISVSKYPVVAIDEIRIGAQTVDPSNYRLQTTSSPGDENAGIIERLDRRVWPERRIEVDYDWGWESPPGTVAAVVEDAVVEVLEKAVVDRRSSGKQSESMDGYSVNWDNSDHQQFKLLNDTMTRRLTPLRRRPTA